VTRASKAQPDPVQPGACRPNGAAAKAGLTKSIRDAGWGVSWASSRAKADSAGRVLIPVDARNTSRLCPRTTCGHIAHENRPTQEKFQCVTCGYTGNADRVAALNIATSAGLVLPEAA
jgi:putative transposase